MVSVVCTRCGHQMAPEALACPGCNFVGPGAGVSAPILSVSEAVIMADGLLAPSWDANGSPVEG